MEKTIAFGGVATGNIKANEQAMADDIIKYSGCSPREIAWKKQQKISLEKSCNLYNNTHSNAIVNAAFNISYLSLLEVAHTGRCYRSMILQFF